MPILHKKSKKNKQRPTDAIELSNRGVSTFPTSHLTPSESLNSFLTNRHNNIQAKSQAPEHALDYYASSYNASHNISPGFPPPPPPPEHGLKSTKKWRLSSRFKFKDCDSSVKCGEVLSESSSSSLRQEVLRHIIARRTLENEKAELTRHLAQKDSMICDMRKQMMHKEKAFHIQRSQFEEAVRNIQNGKPFRPFSGEGAPSSGRGQGGGAREELQLVREAIAALRGNFRGTDPNQHTLDTLEQAISVLMERGSVASIGAGETLGGGKKDKRNTSASSEPYTKVIYFTDRTVTPFMSSMNKRLGDVTLRDFKNLFDRPGCFRFHFKSHDPEYGLVKEEIMNDDDILPGVDGKIIAWVEEDIE